MLVFFRENGYLVIVDELKIFKIYFNFKVLDFLSIFIDVLIYIGEVIIKYC